MVWGSVLISLFHMWLFSLPSTICWRDRLFSIVYSCLLCHRLNVGAWVCFWTFQSVSLIYVSVLFFFFNLLPISHNRCFQAWDRSDFSICGLCECEHVGAGLGPSLSFFHSLHSGSRCMTNTVLAPDSCGSGLVKTMPERHQGQLLSYPWLRWDWGQCWSTKYSVCISSVLWKAAQWV